MAKISKSPKKKTVTKTKKKDLVVKKNFVLLKKTQVKENLIIF